MANVMHHHIEFSPLPVAHAPSPFSFGFGLGQSSSGWQATPATSRANPLSFHQLASSSSLNHGTLTAPLLHKSTKRRLEVEDEDSPISLKASVNTDESMDRSPTPERPKRVAPKRARIVPGTKEQAATKENKSLPSEEDEIDVGVLLASLPTQALLPLLTSLLKTHPSLKPALLPLIPRPTLDTAVQALAQASRKLRDAYPYSSTTSFSQPIFGDGSRPPNTPTSSCQNRGMRDAYVISRLRPRITEFVAACTSYLPYFSCIPHCKQASASTQHQAPPPPPDFAQFSKEKSYPPESFIYLSAITRHVMDQPPLTQTSIAPLLFSRLGDEWNAWVDKVDEIINHQGGIFGIEQVRTWENALDGFADAKGFEGSAVMKDIRDKWVLKVGWLVNRVYHVSMDV